MKAVWAFVALTVAVLALEISGAGHLPWPVHVYLVVGVITLAAYGLDKRHAGKGGRRIPEATLHLLEFLGGWPGALLGQRIFRHKTRKTSYQAVFWLIGALHAAGWAWWATR